MAEQNEIVLYQPNEQTKLEVRLENETVWLNQDQMASLFQRDRSVITKHIRNIYAEHELEPAITCAKFAHMGIDGDQQYETTYYALDVIISVGYRVKSIAGTRFRQWANSVLKNYLLKGYAINQRLLRIENEIDAHRQLLIDNTVYHIGASIKDLGKKLFAFSKMEMPAKDILKQIK